jgi:hypothetical protein
MNILLIYLIFYILTLFLSVFSQCLDTGLSNMTIFDMLMHIVCSLFVGIWTLSSLIMLIGVLLSKLDENWLEYCPFKRKNNM